MLDLKELKEAVETTTAAAYGWRLERQIDADYHDNRMLDPEQARRMEEAGIKTQALGGNLIQQAVRDATAGAWTNRRDAKISASPDGEEAALEAMQEKMRIAEEESNCDIACLNAHRSQAALGLGWTSVERLEDPFGPKYAVRRVHINEMFWPQTPSVELPEVDEMPYLLRRRWTSVDWAVARYPRFAQEIMSLAGMAGDLMFDSYAAAVSSKIASLYSREDHLVWFDPYNKSVCLTEALVARHRDKPVIDLGQGRVELLDIESLEHLERAASAPASIRMARIREIERTLWCGNIRIHEEILSSRYYPYVPFVYHVDMTSGYPYGIAAIIRPLQNERVQRLAAGTWAMGSMRIIRTDGAVRMPDDIFRRQAGSKNADYVLDHRHMANPGAKFEIIPGWQESAAHYNRVKEIDEEAKRAAGTSLALEMVPGVGPNENYRVGFEQQAKATAELRRKYDAARLKTLELLLEMVIEDSLEHELVLIPKKHLRESIQIEINVQQPDGRKANDVRRLRAKIVLEDVPSSPEKSKQELISLTELGKSLSERFRDAMVPYVVNSTGLPFKDDLVEKFAEISNVPTAEQIEADKQAAVEAAVNSEELKLRARELDIKEIEVTAKAGKTEAETGTERAKTVFTTTQAAGTVVQNAAIAPAVEEMLASVGFEDQNGPTAFGSDLSGGFAPAAAVAPRQNTSPQLPPVVPEPPEGAPVGTQTPIPAASPAVGAQSGIETDEIEEMDNGN